MMTYIFIDSNPEHNQTAKAIYYNTIHALMDAEIKFKVAQLGDPDVGFETKITIDEEQDYDLSFDW